MASARNNIQKKFYENRNPGYLIYRKNIPYARYLTGIMFSSLSGKPDNILEVGAGQGRFTFEMSKRLKRITATDLSEYELKLLNDHKRETGNRNIETRVFDLIKDKAWGKRLFDNVVGFHVLHHLPKEKYPQIVRNLNVFLKSRGRMSFIEPNNLYPFHLVEMMIVKDMEWKIEKGIYTNYISLFKEACKNEGMKIVHSRKFGFIPPPLINRWPFLVMADRIVQNIPIIRQVLCPFILLTFEKEES